MTARTGLADNILYLRGLTNAGTADYTLGTAVYWDDDHMQTVLDNHRVDFFRAPLGKVQQYEGGSVIYKVYRSEYTFIESGTAFEVQNAAGSAIGTALYTLDAQRGMVTFASDTGGSSYYITGKAYQMNPAAAEVWRMKAANVSAAFDFSTDNHKMTRSQMHKQFTEMAEYYEQQSGVMSVEMYRSDDAD